MSEVDETPDPRASTTGEPADVPMMRIDPHVHTLASDGIHDVETMIKAAMGRGLDAIGISDHERMDAAIAGKAIAEGRGWPIEVIVGEEISTRGGHLLGLYMTKRIRPWHSLKDSIAKVHEQGGLAIIAHPLPPYPLCASEGSIRKLMDEADPIFHPDGMEGFNPTTARMRWSRKAPALAQELGIAETGGSDAHKASNVGSTVTTFPGSSMADFPAALAARTTRWEGRAYTWQGQLLMFTQQQRKNLAAVYDEVDGKLRRNGTGRDLGYPGGRKRPVRFDRVAAGLHPEGDSR